MNPRLAKVSAALSKNKVALGALGAAAVAALAWRARSGQPGQASASPASAGVSASPGYYSTGGQSGGATGYDSSASDVYNAIQPQLEELGRLWEQTKSPTPVPAPAPAKPAPVVKPATPTFATNREWQNAALGWWAKQGKNVRDIQFATTAFLGGTTMNTAHLAGVNKAIAELGAPPEGTKGISRVVPS